MADDRYRAPWPGTTYNGFSQPGAAPPRGVEPSLAAEPPPRRRGLSRGMMFGGVAAALGAGLLFGLAARPDLETASERRPMQPAPRAATVPVVVASAPAAPAASATKLEVLPRDAPYAAPPQSPTASRSEAPPAPRVEALPARAAAPEPMRPDATSAASVTPSFDCRRARTRAERMVCADPGLAQLDRRLDRAFRRAVSSGAPYGALRAEQDDWLDIRELAARRSPRDVASIYRQRIAELNEMAE